MGYGHIFKCKKCGYKDSIFLNVGRLYSRICSETKQSALFGEMGKDWLEFVDLHPNGSFDCTNGIYLCSCGSWLACPNNDYYVPDDGQELNPYFVGYDSFPGLVKHSQHHCPKCGKTMHRTAEKELYKLKCPKCGRDITWELGAIMWD